MMRIGLSACFSHGDPRKELFNGKKVIFAERTLTRYIMRHKCLLYIIPAPEDETGTSIEELCKPLDGLILHGGADISPESYGETAIKPIWSGDRFRDIYDMELIRCFLKQKKPILGICRGMQIINVFFGGTMHQDIIHCGVSKRVHRDAAIYEANEHDAKILPETMLSTIYPGKESVRINSIHHQAVKTLGKDLAVTARSTDDDVIEGIYLKSDNTAFCLGVQWHPEFHSHTDERLLAPDPLMQAFLKACTTSCS